MNFDSAMEELDREGFSWARFREYFPFGDISLREGNYEKLVGKVLSQLNSNDKKELLLNMLDAQNCVFLEQLWIQNEQTPDAKPFPAEGHFVSAQLQINSNYRWELGLSRRDARKMMIELTKDEMLIDRMLIPLPKKKAQDNAAPNQAL